jgi:hypothetical protein
VFTRDLQGKHKASATPMPGDSPAAGRGWIPGDAMAPAGKRRDQPPSSRRSLDNDIVMNTPFFSWKKDMNVVLNYHEDGLNS